MSGVGWFVLGGAASVLLLMLTVRLQDWLDHLEDMERRLREVERELLHLGINKEGR